MDRRTFLMRLPALTAGALAGSRLAGAEPSAQRECLTALLMAAEQHYAAAHELIHWPHRYHEAKPLLVAALEAAAEAWLLHRGVDAKTQAHYTWLFMASTRPDEITGIAWRGAHAMLSRMQGDCDHMPLFFAKGISMQVRCTMIERSRATLVLALNQVAHCIEGARREALLGLAAAINGPSLPSMQTPAERLGTGLTSLMDEYDRRHGKLPAARPAREGEA